MTNTPLKVAVEALRLDAEKWHQVARVMAGAKGIVDGEAQLTSAFGFIGESVGADKAYASVQTTLSDLALQAQEMLESGARNLRDVAFVYEDAESDSTGLVKKTAWRVL